MHKYIKIYIESYVKTFVFTFNEYTLIFYKIQMTTTIRRCILVWNINIRVCRLWFPADSETISASILGESETKSFF